MRGHGSGDADPGVGLFDGDTRERLVQAVLRERRASATCAACRRIVVEAALRDAHTADVGGEGGVDAGCRRPAPLRWNRRRDRRPRTGPRDGSSSPTAPAERQPCLLVAGDDLGPGAGDDGAEHLAGHREEVFPVGCVAGGGCGDHAHGGGAGVRDHLRVLAQRDPGAFDGLGREAPGRVDALSQPHDRASRDAHRQATVARRRRRSADGWSWCRSRLRRPGSHCSATFGVVDAGPVRGNRGAAQLSVARPASATDSSPSGLTPGPLASECAISTCRHFTRSGIPPPVKSVPSDSISSRSAR